MTRSNLSEYENQELFQRQMCSPDLVLTYQIICLTVINVFLSITAILGNTLILAALQKESSIHPPSKLLLRSLATTDLCVGLISEPLHIIYEMSLVNERWNICRYAVVSSFLAGYILGSVSLLTLTAISVDRLLALLLGLGYRQVVTCLYPYILISLCLITLPRPSRIQRYFSHSAIVNLECMTMFVRKCGVDQFCLTCRDTERQ